MKIITRSTGASRRLWLTLPPMVALAAASGVVQSREGNVFALKLTESLQYDDNVFRLSPDTDNRKAIGSDRRDEFISSTTVAVEANKQFGRQNLYGDLSRTYVLFQEFRRLNYTGENSRVGWRGGYGAANMWDAYFSRSATQSDFADLQTALSNVVTIDTVGANTSIRLATNWVLRPAAWEDKFSNSADSRKNGDGKSQNASVDFGYHPYSGNVLEAQFRHLDRDYDVGGGYVQKEMGALGTWVPNSVSTLEIRAGRLDQRVKTGGSNGNGNFHQMIGYINYRWRPTGASTLSLKSFREISTVNLGTEQDAAARGVTAVWTWMPLAKVKFDSTFDYRKRTFTQISLRDQTRTLSVGAAYLPTDSLTVQASVKNENRHAEPSSRSYKARVYSLSLQYGF